MRLNTETAVHIQKTTGSEVFHLALDVTDSAEVAAFVGAVETRFGRIDVCVTNSGGPPSKSFRETKPEEWRAAVVAFLASERAGYVNGTSVAVDGGLVRSLL